MPGANQPTEKRTAGVGRAAAELATFEQLKSDSIAVEPSENSGRITARDGESDQSIERKHNCRFEVQHVQSTAASDSLPEESFSASRRSKCAVEGAVEDTESSASNTDTWSSIKNPRNRLQQPEQVAPSSELKSVYSYYERHSFTSEEEGNRRGFTSFCLIHPSPLSDIIDDEFLEE